MRKKGRINKICLNCESPFSVELRRKDTAKYCSDKCRIACLRPKDYVCTPAHAKAISIGKTGKSVPKLQGKNHYKWKGDDVTYSGLHHWVKKELGSPQYCEHCGESERYLHWANKSQQYKRDVDDWISLCVPCHKEYDKDVLKVKPSLHA